MFLFKHTLNLYHKTAGLLVVLVILTAAIIYVIVSSVGQPQQKSQISETSNVLTIQGDEDGGDDGTPSPSANPSATPSASPTTTVSPTVPSSHSARIGLTLTLPGIGSNTSLGQNPNPTPRDLTAVLTLTGAYSASARVVTGTVSYDPISSNFKGTIAIENIANGFYTAKVNLKNTLKKLLASSLSIPTPATSISAQPLTLVPGDLNNDNELSLIDYNIFLSCYDPRACQQKQDADLNLDGKVDELDLNIFYSSLRKRVGD